MRTHPLTRQAARQASKIGFTQVVAGNLVTCTCGYVGVGTARRSAAALAALDRRVHAAQAQANLSAN